MRAVFAHHMSPEIGVQSLRQYRRDFRPGVEQQPWSAISVLTFASDDPDAIARFEAGWALTMSNLRRGIREPLRPEVIAAFSESDEFRSMPNTDGRMITGRPDEVVKRLRDLQTDEVVLVTPTIDRPRRIASFKGIAAGWRSTQPATTA